MKEYTVNAQQLEKAINGVYGKNPLWRHYMDGNGRPINLASIGLLNRFRRMRSVKLAVAHWQLKQKQDARRIVSAAKAKGSDTNERLTHFVTDSDKTETDVTLDPVLLPIGRSTFFRSARWNLEANLGSGRYTMEGLLIFEIRDKFIDAADFWSSRPGNQEFPNGTPYNISARWSQ